MVIQLAKDHITNHLMGDWIGAVAHMSTKVAMHFPPSSKHKRDYTVGYHKVSNASTDGRGRGRERPGAALDAAEVDMILMVDAVVTAATAVFSSTE